MTDYSFAAKFDAAPLGSFTAANKALVWPPDQGFAIYDPDPGGNYFELVDDARLGGRCCRMRYPAGAWGMGWQFYQLQVKAPGTVANLEFDWLFEDGFDLAPPNPEKAGGGKIGPCINWGEVGGVTEKRGTRPMIWYNGNGSNYQKPVYSPSCQDQRSGSQHIQPVVYTAQIVLEQIYHWKIQIRGGNDGFANFWLGGEKIASVGPKFLQVDAETDNVIFDFAFFAGGGQNQACRWDSFARHGNVRCWSGESDAPTPPTPEPVPPPQGDGFTVTLDGVTYDATGSLILTPKEN